MGAFQHEYWQLPHMVMLHYMPDFLKTDLYPAPPTPPDHHHTLYHLTLRSAKGS